jgi:hypothetical protein
MQESIERKSMAPLKFSRYDITNDGRVFRVTDDKELKGTIRERRGIPFQMIGLINDEQKNVLVCVHRAVLQIFVGPAPENMFALHISDNTLDNNLTNLKWGLRSNNSTGRTLSYTPRPVLQYDLSGVLIKRWENSIIAARSLGHRHHRLEKIIKQEKIAHGFKWCYESDDIIEGEIWKPIGIENYSLYTISNMGRIKKPGDDKCYIGYNTDGYLSFILHNDKTGEEDLWRVHRLVAFTFLEHIEGVNTVNHKNGIRSDNRVSNLEFLTQRENTLHAYGSNLVIKNGLCIAIIKIDKQTDEILDYYDSLVIASKITKCSAAAISSVCKGKSVPKRSFTWSYANNPKYAEKLKIYKMKKSNELSTDFVQSTGIKSETCGTVTHIDLINRQITKYKTVKEASIATGLTVNNIRVSSNIAITNTPRNSIWKTEGYYKQEFNKNMFIHYIVHKDGLCI